MPGITLFDDAGLIPLEHHLFMVRPDVVAGIVRGLKDHKAGRVRPWDKIKAELGLEAQKEGDE